MKTKQNKTELLKREKFTIQMSTTTVIDYITSIKFTTKTAQKSLKLKHNIVLAIKTNTNDINI